MPEITAVCGGRGQDTVTSQLREFCEADHFEFCCTQNLLQVWEWDCEGMDGKTAIKRNVDHRGSPVEERKCELGHKD